MADLITNAVALFGNQNEKKRGAFYTRNEVVSFMLDVSGYTNDKDLQDKTLLDPGFGEGVFVLEAIDRLLQSLSKESVRAEHISGCIRAYEVAEQSHNKTWTEVVSRLTSFGFSKVEAEHVASEWLVLDDYLLAEPGKFDFIVGNPPYVRLENLSQELLSEYKNKFITIGKRTDLYIPFFEHSLNHLKKEGILSFICTDRWTKNQYGEKLRDLIDAKYYLESVIKISDEINPFESNVSAYPSIFNIRGFQSECRPVITKLNGLDDLGINKAKDALDRELEDKVCHGVKGSSFHAHKTNLENLFKIMSGLPAIEEAGLKVGIGVATGKDKVFIVDETEVQHFESERLIKLALRDDVSESGLRWSGKYLVNTFANDGRVINLDDYPKTKQYFLEHQTDLQDRHVAKKRPDDWYRTIDKPNLNILKQDRLYVPDIMFSPTISHVNEDCYPHHNLYWITSDFWDLRAIKAVLKSVIGFLYIDTYSTTMRGGYYRYQAQTLRKIRIPSIECVNRDDVQEMAGLADSFDYDAIDNVVARVYGIENTLIDKAFNEDEQLKTRLSKLRENSVSGSEKLLVNSR